MNGGAPCLASFARHGNSDGVQRRHTSPQVLIDRFVALEKRTDGKFLKML